MSTQQAPQRSNRPAAPAPDVDPVPKNLRPLRLILTTLSVTMLVAGAGWSAFALGVGGNRYLPGAVFIAGIALFIAASRPGLYLAIAEARARSATARAHRKAAPSMVVRPAGRAQARGQRGRQQSDAVGRVAPDRALGEDFCFIITNGRRLRSDRVAAMQERYAEMMADPEGDYYAAVDLVRSIAQEHPHYAEAGEDNFHDPRNPGLFLAELDETNGSAAAVAALLLVKEDDAVTEDIFNEVMAPWIDLRLPFLYNGVRYMSDGTQVVKAPLTRPSPPAGTPVAYAAPAVSPRASGRIELKEQVAAARPPTRAAAAPAGSPEWLNDHLPVDQAAVPAPAQAGRSEFTVDDLALCTELIITSQLGSIPMIQRKMRVGFAMAGAMFDRLEQLDIVRHQVQGAGYEVLVPAAEATETVEWIKQNA